MEVKYKCPLCESTDVMQEEDFELVKEKIRSKVNPNNDISLDRKLNGLLNYNPYDDEVYLKHLEKHGFMLTCRNCGYIFYEKDKKEEFPTKTIISLEEFNEIVFEAIDDCFTYDIKNKEALKKTFVSFSSTAIKTYYKEYAIMLAEEYYTMKANLDKYNDLIKINTTEL